MNQRNNDAAVTMRIKRGPGIAGGGCLSLVNNVIDVLDLAKGDVTVIWDTGHNL